MRDRQAERLGGPQVEDQLDLRGLLNREIRRLRPFEYLLHQTRGLAAELIAVRPVAGQSGPVHKERVVKHGRHPPLERELHEEPGNVQREETGVEEAVHLALLGAADDGAGLLLRSHRSLHEREAQAAGGIAMHPQPSDGLSIRRVVDQKDPSQARDELPEDLHPLRHQLEGQVGDPR